MTISNDGNSYDSKTGAGQPSAAERSGQTAAQAKDKAREQAGAAAREASAMGKAQVDQHKQTAADQIEKLAEGARAAASELDNQDQQMMSHYLQDMAGGMANFATSLRDRNADQLLRDASTLARRNPGLFIAGSIAVGFGLSRLARASAHHSESDHRRGDGTDSETTTAGASTRFTGSGDYAGSPSGRDDLEGLHYGNQPVGGYSSTTPANGASRYSTDNGQNRTGGPLS